MNGRLAGGMPGRFNKFLTGAGLALNQALRSELPRDNE
jgi:hypothetical protein